MSTTNRREDDTEGRRWEASDSSEAEHRDEIARRQQEGTAQPGLTRREREERWPIG